MNGIFLFPLLFFIVVDIVMIKIFLKEGRETVKKEKRCTEQVEATVESVERIVKYRKGKQRVSYFGKCSYEYNGTQYISDSVSLKYSVVGRFEGSTIQLFINPDYPQEAIIKTNIAKISRRASIYMPLFFLAYLVPTFMANMFSIDLGDSLGEKLYKAHLNKKYAYLDDYVNHMSGSGATDMPTQEPTPMPAKLIQGKYCGVIISLPDYFKEGVYAGNNVKSGHCYFSSNKSEGIIFDIKVAANNTILEKAIDSLQNYVRKKGSEPTLCKKVMANGQTFEVYSVKVGTTSDYKTDYDYYAISASAKTKIILTHYEDEEELYRIIETVKY